MRAALFGALLLLSAAAFIGKQDFFFRLTVFASLIMVVLAVSRLAAVLSPKPKASPHTLHTDWPIYTVLVPLYKEANVVKSLISHLAQIDYPADRLEIFLICEADDGETLGAIPGTLPCSFRVIEVPPSEPRTKPKALNYALKYARGELVTIYDAEDRPSPMQLKAAATALIANETWAAVQAPLDYYNSDQNLLTRQFTIEYAALFHVWLPFLASCGLPFPLGGTSNHIRGLM